MITEPNEFMQRLQELQDSSSVTYSTLPSNEPRFIIDANSRTIKIPPEFQFLGVKNDHKAETVYFEIDRYFDSEDLSTHTCVVQFENKSGEGGIYPVTIMDTESIDGKIIFGWEILSDATTIVGDIIFSVRFYSLDNYVFTYNFNTLPAKSVILDTLNVDDPTVVENYPSELEAWLDRMNDLSQNVVKPEDVELLDTKMDTLETSFGELETNVNSSVDELKSDIDNYKKNEYVPLESTDYTFIDNYLYDCMSIIQVESSAWCHYRIPVKGGEKYRLNTLNGSRARAYIIYRSSGSVIAFYNEDNTAQRTVEVTIPANASLMIVNARKDGIIELEKESSLINADKVSDKILDRLSNLEIKSGINYLKGKKLVTCGDSITEAINPDGGYFKNYGEIVAERNNMIFSKDGIGGSTMANIGSGKSFTEGRYLNHTDFDYLTIWFGWNDGAYSELGTIDDSTDTTFYGAYKKVLTHYLTNYPTKKIGIIVPYMSDTRYQNAVRELSQMFGVPCLDLTNGNNCSVVWGLSSETQLARRSALTYDGTHPNQTGYEFIASMYENFLRSL